MAETINSKLALISSLMLFHLTDEVIQDHIASRGLTVEDLKQQCCTEDVLLKLSKDLHNWEVVGLYLNLTKSEIKGIKVDYSSEEERRIHTLTKWKEKNGDDATYYNLIDALIDGDRVDIVDTALDCLKASKYLISISFFT